MHVRGPGPNVVGKQWVEDVKRYVKMEQILVSTSIQEKAGTPQATIFQS